MFSAIVLAAGLGKKVWPYGEFRQKCTLPVANTPIVRRLVENLVQVGCEQVIVVVGHYAQQVRGCRRPHPRSGICHATDTRWHCKLQPWQQSNALKTNIIW